MVRNLFCSNCVISVPLHRHFSPSLLFPIPPNSDQFMWSLLALAANPTIHKIKERSSLNARRPERAKEEEREQTLVADCSHMLHYLAWQMYSLMRKQVR